MISNKPISNRHLDSNSRAETRMRVVVLRDNTNLIGEATLLNIQTSYHKFAINRSTFSQIR